MKKSKIMKLAELLDDEDEKMEFHFDSMGEMLYFIDIETETFAELVSKTCPKMYDMTRILDKEIITFAIMCFLCGVIASRRKIEKGFSK